MDEEPKIEGSHLRLPRCPRCGIAAPNLVEKHAFQTEFSLAEHAGPTISKTYICGSCVGVVFVRSWLDKQSNPSIFRDIEILPNERGIDESIPKRAAHYLREAMDTVASPSASIIVSASAVDAMLKEIGLKKGT